MPIRIKWNMPGFEKLRRHQATDDLLMEKAQTVADKCGDGYVAVPGTGKTRDRASVITTTRKAIKDNAENNTILRNLGTGG